MVTEMDMQFLMKSLSPRAIDAMSRRPKRTSSVSFIVGWRLYDFLMRHFVRSLSQAGEEFQALLLHLLSHPQESVFEFELSPTH
jgi:hypothetical protein